MEPERPRAHAKRLLDDGSEESDDLFVEEPASKRFSFSRSDVDIGEEPKAEDTLPLLEQWAVVNSVSPNMCPYKDPMVYGVAVLRGTVTGHPVKRDGDTIWTSPLLFQKSNLARTLSRWFRLGTPDSGYVEHMTKEGKDAWGNPNGVHCNPQHLFTEKRDGTGWERKLAS